MSSPQKPPQTASIGANSAQTEAVLAIDPGSHKCGIAVVRRDGGIPARGVVSTEALIEEIHTYLSRWHPVALIVGTGTGSKPLLQRIEAAAFGLPIERMDESHTSEAARTRFVSENPPSGWQRLLPLSLRTPDRPYDDYVAVILAERYWEKRD